MATDVPVVRVADVSKRFVIRKEKSLKERIVNAGRSRLHKDDFWALRNVDFEICSGSTVGLIGANGSGKSTLLKLIGGIMQPTSGQVTRRGRLAALIELGAGFHPDLTGRENIYLNCAILGLTREQTRRHFDSIVDFSGIEQFIDTQVKFYSSGMYVRLAFAVAVHVDPDVLLVDEVLAVGDEPFQRKCMDRINGFQSEGRTIIIVTHALDQVAELCDRAIVLEHGAMKVDDKPLEALRYLRGEFEQTRQEDLERSRAARAAELHGEGHIAKVEVVDPDGNPMRVMLPGQDLALRVTVASRDELRDWVLGIQIENNHRVHVFGTNTHMLHVTLPPVHGERTIQIRLPNLWLAEGNYTVMGVIAATSGYELHRLPEAAAFAVHGDGSMTGTVYVRPEIRQD